MYQKANLFIFNYLMQNEPIFTARRYTSVAYVVALSKVGVLSKRLNA